MPNILHYWCVLFSLPICFVQSSCMFCSVFLYVLFSLPVCFVRSCAWGHYTMFMQALSSLPLSWLYPCFILAERYNLWLLLKNIAGRTTVNTSVTFSGSGCISAIAEALLPPVPTLPEMDCQNCSWGYGHWGFPGDRCNMWKNRSSWPPSADFCWPSYLSNNQRGKIVRLLRRGLVKVPSMASQSQKWNRNQ